MGRVHASALAILASDDCALAALLLIEPRAAESAAESADDAVLDTGRSTGDACVWVPLPAWPCGGRRSDRLRVAWLASSLPSEWLMSSSRPSLLVPPNARPDAMSASDVSDESNLKKKDKNTLRKSSKNQRTKHKNLLWATMHKDRSSSFSNHRVAHYLYQFRVIHLQAVYPGLD